MCQSSSKSNNFFALVAKLNDRYFCFFMATMLVPLRAVKIDHSSTLKFMEMREDNFLVENAFDVPSQSKLKL